MTLHIGKLYRIEAGGATFTARLRSIGGKTVEDTIFSFRSDRETFEWSAAEVAAASFTLISED